MKLMGSFMYSFLSISSRRSTIARKSCFSTIYGLSRAQHLMHNRPVMFKTSTSSTNVLLPFVGVLVLAATKSSTVLCATSNDVNHHRFFSEKVIEMDTYNGVIIKLDEAIPSKTLDDDEDEVDYQCPISFENRLKSSLELWRNQGKRGVWIHLTPTFSHLIPICTQVGFDFHFAKPGKLVLTTWLPADTESRLPNGPTHQVGVGVLVLREKNNNPHEDDKRKHQMLVVQERTGPASKFSLWKLPTGLLEPGEDIGAAAQRELLEETGLHATMDQILSFRQAHSVRDYGSDLFFVCLMKLLKCNSDESDEGMGSDPRLIPQEEEIAAIQWMDVDDFCAQEFWQRSPVFTKMNEVIQLAIQHQNQKVKTGMEQQILEVGFRPGTNAVYLPGSLRSFLDEPLSE